MRGGKERKEKGRVEGGLESRGSVFGAPRSGKFLEAFSEPTIGVFLTCFYQWPCILCSLMLSCVFVSLTF